MKRMWTWFLLLNKRLYLKITFLILILLIPIFVTAFQIMAQQPSGVVTVVLARQDPQDALCREIVESLKSETKIISFLEDTPENAQLLVKAGKADAAWIFPEDMAGCLSRYLTGDAAAKGFVKVLEREQTVVLGLARERLNGVLFGESVRQIYLRYVRQWSPEAEKYSDAELLSYIDQADVTGQLFAYYDIYGNQKLETANYLTAPIRGLLAVLVAIGSAVTAMYYQKDSDLGIFSFLPQRYAPLCEFGYQLVSSFNLMTMVLLSLIISGLSENLLLELILFLLYGICCSLFGMVLRKIFGGGRWLAVWMPVIALFMLVICPVFFDVAAMQKLQLIFPPTYYISGAYNYAYWLYFIGYIGIMVILYWMLSVIKGKRSGKR